MTPEQMKDIFESLAKLEKEEYDVVWKEFYQYFETNLDEARAALEIILHISYTFQRSMYQMQQLYSDDNSLPEC
jgi:HSP90 family molecular chaperone